MELAAHRVAFAPLPEVGEPNRLVGVTDQVTTYPGKGFWRGKVFAVVHTTLPPATAGISTASVVIGLMPSPSQLLNLVALVPPPVQELKNLPLVLLLAVVVHKILWGVPPDCCPTILRAPLN